MKDFLMPKIDAAVDIVDEAMLILEELGLTEKDEARKLELKSDLLEATRDEDLLLKNIDEISRTIAVEEPTKEDLLLDENYHSKLEKMEADLIKSWNTIRSLSTDKDDNETNSKKEVDVRLLISKKYSHLKLFLSKNINIESFEAESSSGKRDSIVKLEKMKPPKFSGNIRHFARFKADFDAIVKPSYEDQIHQMYILSEICLTGPAYDLVRNLESMDNIWNRKIWRYNRNCRFCYSRNSECNYP